MSNRLRSRHLAIALLAFGCERASTSPAPFPDASGAWFGANDVVALDVRLVNAVVTYPCAPFGCSGEQTMQQITLAGSYTDLGTGEVFDLASDTQRRRDGLVFFTLLSGDDSIDQVHGGTYWTRNLSGRIVDTQTIEATIFTDYQRSSGGSSISWTTWSADSSAITLHRR